METCPPGGRGEERGGRREGDWRKEEGGGEREEEEKREGNWGREEGEGRREERGGRRKALKTQDTEEVYKLIKFKMWRKLQDSHTSWYASTAVNNGRRAG